MKKKARLIVVVVAGFAALFPARAQSEEATPVRRGLFIDAERSIYLARSAEKRGDIMTAAQEYTSAISLVQSNAPTSANQSKLVLDGEPLPSIGRRMISYDIRLYLDMVKQQRPLMRPETVLENLRGAYGKMAWIEKSNPTWPYLEAVALAANQDYRAAFQKCREAAELPGGEESIRQKARSLANHIKPAALAQEKMREDDQRAYQQYVESGAQALDFSALSARESAAQARKNGDMAAAEMWERRFSDLKKERERLGR
jgi:hypothetical protein